MATQICYIDFTTTLVETNVDRCEVLDSWNYHYMDDEEYEYQLKQMRGSCRQLVKASFFGITDDEIERYQSCSSQYYDYMQKCGARLDDEQEARSGTLDAAMTFAQSVLEDKINAGLRKLTYMSSSDEEEEDDVSSTDSDSIKAEWTLPPRTAPLNDLTEPFYTYDQVLDIVQAAVAPFFADRSIKMLEAVTNPDGSRDAGDRKTTRVGLTDFVLRAVAQELVDRNPSLDTRLGLPSRSILGVLLDKDSGDL